MSQENKKELVLEQKSGGLDWATISHLRFSSRSHLVDSLPKGKPVGNKRGSFAGWHVQEVLVVNHPSSWGEEPGPRTKLGGRAGA